MRPVYDDPDQAARPTPLMKARAIAERFGKTVDVGLYQPNGYLKPRAEFGESLDRSVWAEVTVAKTNSTRIIVLDDGSSHAEKRAKGDAYCKIKRIDFNPGSRDQIIDRLVIMHNWTPTDFTDSGKPEVNDEVLTKLKDTVPEAADFADLFFYNKILGQLETGANSWLNKYDPDTEAIHGTINTGGTVSGRCSHSNPNLGQVPAVQGKKRGREGEYGYECRSLFHTPAEINGVPWKQIGCDLVNIEARALAAVLAPYDDGELIDVLVNQGVDLHSFNMAKTGIDNRGLIKRVFFGLIYGAGDLKLGATAEPYWSEHRQRKYGKELRDTIMKGVPALKKASDAIKAQAKLGYLIGLDGRRLHVRAEYAALNLRLQSDAAMIAKKWCLLTEEALIDAGGVHGWDGDFAMMAFVHDEIQLGIKAYFAEQGAELVKDAARRAGEFFNFRCPVAADAKIGQNWQECH